MGKLITTLPAHIQTLSGENELVIKRLFSWFVVYEAVEYTTCGNAFNIHTSSADAYTAVRSAPGQQEVTLKPTSALL